MFGVILGIVKTVLGIGVAGASTPNTVGGIANHVIAIPVLIWLGTHADQQINFATSYGFLALVVGVAYLILEVLRRSKPGA